MLNFCLCSLEKKVKYQRGTMRFWQEKNDDGQYFNYKGPYLKCKNKKIKLKEYMWLTITSQQNIITFGAMI